MIRRTFLRRMMGAALASGLLGSELLARRDWPHRIRDAEIATDMRAAVTSLEQAGFSGPYEIHMHPDTWREVREAARRDPDLAYMIGLA